MIFIKQGFTTESMQFEPTKPYREYEEQPLTINLSPSPFGYVN